MQNIVFVQRISACLTPTAKHTWLLKKKKKKMMYARYVATNQYSTAYH